MPTAAITLVVFGACTVCALAGRLRTFNASSSLAPASASCQVPPGMRKVRTSAGFDMVVLGDNDIVSMEIAKRGYWEIKHADEMIAQTGGTLPKDGLFLDVGANLGYYTFLFANKGYKTISVEPMTRNRMALSTTLCLNPNFKNLVTVVPAALGAPEDLKASRCRIRSTNAQINIGNGWLICGDKDEVEPCALGDKNCEEVPMKTLDGVLAELKPTSIEAVKLDIENYECKVFRGGQTMFKKYQPEYLKVETAWGNTSSCVREEASKHGYRLTPLQGDTLMEHKASGAGMLVRVNSTVV
eukprot:gnl/TRDRNA2_/TRDRNA2_188533_c0_seq1.p1 gnl/TRDRNA2_/TRDRNA2_188533_c0~~gnl/TRDRNA2_/TRDRNA2_188533_c0_seq1.p1  ORF type:complete len:299 (+),score=52.68 gnl/TRDRNA2_/TRDRNA2_188533_c0_seq1:100-996(+)